MFILVYTSTYIQIYAYIDTITDKHKARLFFVILNIH